MTSFEALRNKDMFRIALFVGSVPDLLSCEKTCRKLRAVVQSDQAWSTCEGEWHDDLIETNRQRAERKYRTDGYKKEALQSIQRHQRAKLFNFKDKVHHEKSHILLTYGVQGWTNFCAKCFSLSTKALLKSGGAVDNTYRWDALLCCAHILESNMIEFLQVSIMLSIHRTSEQENVYPVLKDVDLTLAVRTTYPVLARLRAVEKNTEMDGQARILVTHLLRMAGIPSSEASARQLVWESFMELTIELLRVAYLWGNPYGGMANNTMIGIQHVEWAAENLKLLYCKAYGINETDSEASDDAEDVDCTGTEDDFVEIVSSAAADDCSDESMSLTDEESVNMSIYSDTECRDSSW